jgi:CubicO group peptidase (beta-lactamase class C family)
MNKSTSAPRTETGEEPSRSVYCASATDPPIHVFVIGNTLKHHVAVCFLLAFAVLATANPGACQPLPETVRYDLRGLQTGMVIATFSADGLISLQAYGSQTPQRKTPLSEDQLFPLPALSEIILGLTVEALAAADALDPDAPISRYMPGLSPTLGRATLHQLLSHTSGLDDARVRPGQTWEEALDELSDWALVTEPGFIFSRSRYSFPLVVRILERTVGETFPELATTAVLDPLGLEGTTFDIEEARATGMIDGLGISTRPDTPFTLISAEPTVRGLPVVFTTTRDVAQLLVAWMTGRLSGAVPWEVRTDTSVPNDAGFRNGVVVDEKQGTVRVSRTTSDLGFGAGIHFFPDLGKGVVAWATAGPPRRTILAAQEQFLGEGMPPVLDSEADITPTVPEPVVDEVSPGSEDETPTDSPGVPLHASGWAGEYRNGDEILQLRQTDGNLTFYTGTGDLGVRPGPDGEMVVTLEDGRATDISFRLILDGKNRRYLLRGEATKPKAFLNEEDRSG